MKKKVKVVSVKETLAVKIYWIEVLKGLWITNNHFVRNMTRHILNSIGVKTREKASETIQYPEERRYIHYRWRGRHRLTQKQDGFMRCTACMMCETACPDDCIHIIPGEALDPTVEKFPEEFFIDALRCCYCGLCAEVCPVDAIRLDVIEPEIASYTRDLIFTRDFLMGIDKDRPWEQWYFPKTDDKGAKTDAA